MPDAKFRVKRFDPARDAQGASRYDDFVVSYDSSLTVLEGLFSIQEHQDGTLAFRYCCRASICGSCAMYINGRYRLACQTNLRHLHADVITVEPMPHLPLVTDLVCDMSELLRQVRVRQALAHPRLGATRSGRSCSRPRSARSSTMPIDCILCGACYSSCPSVWYEDDYLGPAALLKAYRFEVDSRDEARQGAPAARGTTSAAPTAVTRSPTASRPAPRSSTPPRASSGSRWRPCGGGCSGAASEAGLTAGGA